MERFIVFVCKNASSVIVKLSDRFSKILSYRIIFNLFSDIQFEISTRRFRASFTSAPIRCRPIPPGDFNYFSTGCSAACSVQESLFRLIGIEVIARASHTIYFRRISERNLGRFLRVIIRRWNWQDNGGGKWPTITSGRGFNSTANVSTTPPRELQGHVLR